MGFGWWTSGSGGVGGRGRASTHGAFLWVGGQKSSVLNPTREGRVGGQKSLSFLGPEGGSLVGGQGVDRLGSGLMVRCRGEKQDQRNLAPSIETMAAHSALTPIFARSRKKYAVRLGRYASLHRKAICHLYMYAVHKSWEFYTAQEAFRSHPLRSGDTSMRSSFHSSSLLLNVIARCTLPSFIGVATGRWTGRSLFSFGYGPSSYALCMRGNAPSTSTKHTSSA